MPPPPSPPFTPTQLCPWLLVKSIIIKSTPHKVYNSSKGVSYLSWCSQIHSNCQLIYSWGYSLQLLICYIVISKFDTILCFHGMLAMLHLMKKPNPLIQPRLFVLEICQITSRKPVCDVKIQESRLLTFHLSLLQVNFHNVFAMLQS